MAAQQNSGALIAMHRALELLHQSALVAPLRRHDQPHTRFAVELAQGEHQLERCDRSIDHQGAGPECVVAPASLQAGRECRLERRMGRFLEQIHDRLADESAGVGDAK